VHSAAAGSRKVVRIEPAEGQRAQRVLAEQLDLLGADVFHARIQDPEHVEDVSDNGSRVS
jgi:hypothetical protein